MYSAEHVMHGVLTTLTLVPLGFFVNTKMHLQYVTVTAGVGRRFFVVPPRINLASEVA